jgi:Na+/H+ antiporter NhaD/arsenite permease-like protein
MISQTVPANPQEVPVILGIMAMTYLGLAIGHVPGLKLNRTGIALLGAIGMLMFGGITTAQAVAFISWPTMFLLFGFFVISAQLRLSGFYEKIAESISSRVGHPARLLLILMAVTGGLSAFLNHDIVCLILAPIVGAALLRHQLNPVPFLIALAISSNIGAAATLIGNPQNMMIGQLVPLAFGHYILWSSVPVLFAMGSAFGIIWIMSSKSIRTAVPPPASPGGPEVPFNRRHTIKGLVVLGIVVGMLFSPVPKEVIALAAAAIHLASPKFHTDELLKHVDWPILILFMGLFVVTGAFQSTGYGEQVVQSLAQHGFHLEVPHNLVLATTALTTLIGNAPAVMLLLKVLHLSTPIPAYILALANSFGGNLFIVGSVANMIVVQQARSMGIKISLWEFSRLGIPVTLAALGGLLAWVALMT